MFKKSSGGGTGSLKVIPGFCNEKSWCKGVLANTPVLQGAQLGVGRLLLQKSPMRAAEFLGYRWEASKWYVFRFCPFCGVNLWNLYVSDGRLKEEDIKGY